MPTITYAGQAYHCRESETVLDALMRQGVTLPFSCRSGICHVCMMRYTAGDVNERAQAGIKPRLQQLGYFLPCRCRPQSDLAIAPPNPDDLYTRALVADKTPLSDSVCRLQLEPATVLDYRPGQFINLRRPDGTARSYSLASIPGDYFLELHVRRRQNGRLSNWIFDELQINDEVEIHGPAGDNYYQADSPQQPLLLIASGTGLAPLWGIARDALIVQGHSGPIHLYHGSHSRDGLYLHQALLELQHRYPHFHYHACISGSEVSQGFRAARADVAALADHPDLDGWRIHIAGNPAMVHDTREAVSRAGARESHILADPFELTDLRGDNAASAEPACGRRAEDHAAAPWKQPEVEFPPPDPELWRALKEGALLSEILPEFYARVYADPYLSPFFKNVTRQRLIEKQYSFLKRAITGEQCYFGERPRNAHHWMVISDELFDYRNDLLKQVAREHGLSEQWIERWHTVEESFRRDIVKNSPWPRVMDGVEMGHDGFGEMVLEEGTLCSSCEQAIDRGESVRYHLRTGETYCPACSA
ncbi:MAG: 2Fe-2S iron-sulfur cluster-binding protein, partial [Thiohalophilus sp.]